MSALSTVLGAATVIALVATGLRARCSPARRVVPAGAGAAAGRWRGLRRPPALRDIDVAAWCEELARRCRAGDSLTLAVREAPAAAALRTVLAPVELALDRGAALPSAIERHLTTTPSLPGSAVLALEVVRVAAEVGGPVAQPLDRAAATLRLRVADAEERAAHSAQARWSARTLTILPVAVLLLLATTSPDIRDVARSPVGVSCLALGAALNLTGWRWMRRIVGSPS